MPCAIVSVDTYGARGIQPIQALINYTEEGGRDLPCKVFHIELDIFPVEWDGGTEREREKGREEGIGAR